jgi:Fe-S cluster biosynthesis and repair protein YggX
MARMVYCLYLKREAEGLAALPHPGELGQRVFENISQEAWQQWLAHLSVLMNQYSLTSADPRAMAFIETQMRAFLFGEPVTPEALPPQRRKK